MDVTKRSSMTEKHKVLPRDVAGLRRAYEEDGFCVAHEAISTEVIPLVLQRCRAVVEGRYETGTAPHSRFWNPGDAPEKLKKINSPHISDSVIFQFVTQPAIGELAAALLNARKIQLWEVQLLEKPPGSASANVGWHQDSSYWTYWAGEVLTCWIPLTDVKAESGPVKFVAGSHRWGLLSGGNFFDGDLSAQQDQLACQARGPWVEVPALLSPGDVSFHHPMTLHASDGNFSSAPRSALALHLLTERARPVRAHYYTTNLSDASAFPVLYPR